MRVEKVISGVGPSFVRVGVRGGVANREFGGGLVTTGGGCIVVGYSEGQTRPSGRMHGTQWERGTWGSLARSEGLPTLSPGSGPILFFHFTHRAQNARNFVLHEISFLSQKQNEFTSWLCRIIDNLILNY